MVKIYRKSYKMASKRNYKQIVKSLVSKLGESLVSKLGGVNMIPGISYRREFTPVPSLSSVFVYMSENFVPARNLTSVSCKRGTTTRSGVKSASRLAGTGSTCALFLIDGIFAIWIYACILSICSVPSGKHDLNSPSHHVNAVRNQEVS